jgi:hypothetical protein
MNELVAVRPRFGFDPATIKRDALLFKQIAIPRDPNLAQEFEIRISEMMGYKHPGGRSNLVPAWLYDEEFLFEPGFVPKLDSFELLEANQELAREFDASVDLNYLADRDLKKNEELNRIVHKIVSLPDDQQEAEIRRFFLDKETAHLMPTVNQMTNDREVRSKQRASCQSYEHSASRDRRQKCFTGPEPRNDSAEREQGHWTRSGSDSARRITGTG